MPNLFDLTGKNALVTGSYKGLGATIAIALAQAGANVAIHGRSGESQSVMDAVDKAGSKAIAVTGDVSNASACEEIVEVTIHSFGSLDILVNNAGIIRRNRPLTILPMIGMTSSRST
jgi:2-deoxy-D-gluconate 3-dehydrogenase